MNGHSVDTPSVDINMGLSESTVGQSIIYLQHMKKEGRREQAFSKHSTTGFDCTGFICVFIEVVAVLTLLSE